VGDFLQVNLIAAAVIRICIVMHVRSCSVIPFQYAYREVSSHFSLLFLYVSGFSSAPNRDIELQEESKRG
jgi:hypothetical protein